MNFILSFLIVLASLFSILSGIWVCTGLFTELRAKETAREDEAIRPVKTQKLENSQDLL